jgi:5-methylcytosine-specific restriction endonuclease McrBC GTP-binding regulatory subunit McrB
MPFNEAKLNGTIEPGNQFLDFNPRELLVAALQNFNWNYTEIEKSGNSLLKCSINNTVSSKNFAFSIGKIQNQEDGRNPNEKRIQLSPKNTTLAFEYEENDSSQYAIIGVYKRDVYEDTIFCGWPKSAIKTANTQISLRVKIDLIAEALVKGFASKLNEANQLVCAFRPEFIHYYLLNKDSLHGTEVIEENEVDESYPLTDQPLNQILYGPPGTGKTHNAVNHALSIIKGNDLSGLSRKQIKMEFDAFVDSGQIQFVTFHQSYSYEEFVEGIKPTVNEKGDIEYHIEDGIFKKLCWDAENDSMLEVGDQFQNSRNTIFTISKYNSQIIEITRDEGSIITLPTDLVIGLLKLIDENIIDITNVQSREKDGVPLQELLDIKFDKYIFGYDSILKALIEFITSKNRSIKKNYVIIIDEINRGNISKIFGELITLIEDSKRIGAKESLRAKLTYSGAESDEMFGVPNNVYIVGTMNTADRSIALIDTALRRRFTFFEYSADISLLDDDLEGINLKYLVSMMNERIEFLLDKDHLLGHAFFLNVKSKDDLCSVFRNKILPLLEEYFYGDYEKIQLVLGDNKEFGKKDENRIIIAKPTSEQKKIFGKEVDGFEEKILYKINEKLETEDFKSITTEFFTSIYLKQQKEA